MENGSVMRSSQQYQPKFNLKISNAAKNGEVIEFFIETKNIEDGSEIVVIRVFEDFELLHHSLSTQLELSHIIFPPLPSKPLTSASAAKKKTKQQLGNASLLVGDDYADDCQKFEKYLQLLTRHKSLGLQPVLKKFLCEKEPEARVKVKRGIFGTITKVVGDAKYAFHKDTNESFSDIKQRNEEMVKYTRSAANDFQKITDGEKRLASLCTNTISVLNGFNQISSEAETDSGLKISFEKLSEGYDHIREVSSNNATNRQRTLAATFELYAKYEESKTATLQKRVQKLMAMESAKKSFENAKPQKKSEADEKLKAAESDFNNISDEITQELDAFQKQRVLAMQSAMIQFADAEIKNSRATYALLAKTMSTLQNSL